MEVVEVPDISYWEENDSEKVKYVVTYLLHDIKELERKNELLNINVEDLQNKIDKVIEYCEDIISEAIDISDNDYDLGEDFTAKCILKILRGDE